MTTPPGFITTDQATAAAASLAGNLETRGWRDAMRAISLDIPDPETYARLMPLAHAEMLLGSTLKQSEYFVPHHHAHILKPFGLVECGAGKRGLTAFAIKVLKALREHDS